MSNLPRAAVCTLALGLSACFRANPTFLLAESGTGGPGGGSEAVGSSGGTTTAGASEDYTTTGSSSSASSSSASASGSTSTSGAGQTTTESSTTEAVGTSTTGGASIRLVFLTSAVFGAKLGGIEGADAKCQAAAESAGLDGTFRAWISTPASSPMVNFVQSSETLRAHRRRRDRCELVRPDRRRTRGSLGGRRVGQLFKTTATAAMSGRTPCGTENPTTTTHVQDGPPFRMPHLLGRSDISQLHLDGRMRSGLLKAAPPILRATVRIRLIDLEVAVS
jgi:hypothetical protein